MENKIIDIIELRDTEHRILSYMVLSFDNINEINKELKLKDFTFEFIAELLYEIKLLLHFKNADNSY